MTDRTEYIGNDSGLEFGSALFGKGDGLFVMHNHPRNSSYSDVDIAFFLSNSNVSSFSIIKNNGSVEILTKSKSFDSNKLKEMFKRNYKKYVKIGKDEEIDKAVLNFLEQSKEMIEWIG